MVAMVITSLATVYTATQLLVTVVMVTEFEINTVRMKFYIMSYICGYSCSFSSNCCLKKAQDWTIF